MTQSYLEVMVMKMKSSLMTLMMMEKRKLILIQYDSFIFVIRELKEVAFLSHGRKPEGDISHARKVVSPRFSN